jgi:universal stress protein A
MLKPTKILVPTDFSEYSDKALEQALDIAKQYHAKVFLLHVVHEEIHRAILKHSPSKQFTQDIKVSHWTETKDRLHIQLNKFLHVKKEEVVTRIREGNPYEKILEFEKEEGIDLIVIASLGRAGIAKYLIGGVTRNVLKGSKCPVLLTK